MGAEHGDPDFNEMIADVASQGPNMSVEEAGSLMGAAIACSEIFESYLQHGFTPAQALYLTGVSMTGNPGIPPRN